MNQETHSTDRHVNNPTNGDVKLIRPYQCQDEETVIEVWYAASLIAHDFVPASFWDTQKQDIRNKYLPVAQTWVYEQDGQIVGFMSLLENYIGALFVHPDYQGQGIGTQLIGHAKAMHRVLLLDVFKQNTRSRHFYEKCGFEVTAENIHEATGCENLSLQMTLLSDP
jgi:putative acetyltransferase